MVNIAYLMILRTGGVDKLVEQWEDMQVWQNTCQAFNYQLSKPYIRYHIRKKATLAANKYGASEKYTQETDTQVNNTDTLQALECEAM